MAKFPGVCGRCGQAFKAGETIRYGGRRRTYHFAARCDGYDGQRQGPTPPPAGEDAHLDDDSAEAVRMRHGDAFADSLR